MKVLLTGATGLVGQRLVESLVLSGYHDLHVLTRDSERARKMIPFPVKFFQWDIGKGFLEKGALEGVDIVIHLAGENVGDGLWTQAKKEKIMRSRKEGGQLLIHAIKKLLRPPRKLISSSAIGIYGDKDSFLARVCSAWEEVVLNHGVAGMRAHCVRTGLVLSPDGGVLQKMLLPFRMGGGGRLGSGSQWMSWIHLDDLVGQFMFLIEHEGGLPTYNGTAPEPVTNRDFTRVLASVLKRPAFFLVPEFVLHLVLGEMAEMLLTGLKVMPEDFLREGFQFKFHRLHDALNDLLNPGGEVVFKRYQWVDRPVDRVFDFFSVKENLQQITPSHLGFKVLGERTEKIDKGSTIHYKLSIYGFPCKWSSKILEYRKDKTFTDFQESGPYAHWIHRHDFIPYKQGTLIGDRVCYRLPFGSVGKAVGGAWVARNLDQIFFYRQRAIAQHFSSK